MVTDTSTSQSSALSNGLAIVEFLAESGDETKSLAEISVTLGLPKASALRLLRSLCESGFVRRSEGSKRYGLTSRLSDLSVRQRVDRSFAEAGAAPLRRLRDETKETAQLVCLHDGASVLIDQQVSTHPFKFVGEIGSRTPWQLCAPGKAMAAALPPDKLAQLLSETRFVRSSPKALSSRKAAVSEIEQIIEQGWALDDEEHIEGLRCVGAAICNLHGQLIGGITVAGFKENFSGPRLDDIVASVLHTCRAIDRAMSG